MSLPAACIATLRPVGTEPVKQTASTVSTNAAPVSPEPVTRRITDDSPAVSMASSSGFTKREVTSLGFIMTEHPASRAGAASIIDKINGKFHGLITPTRP